jgi:hypothetical protein
VSGGGWLIGYTIYIPFTTTNSLYQTGAMIYALHVMLFQNRLTVDDWLKYPLRRWGIQLLITCIGYLVMFIPGLSAFIMPFLGVWAVNDFLDYQGWDQLGDTLSIPFDVYYYNA